MLLTYQCRLQPTLLQGATLSHWRELLRRHWNYTLGQRLDWLRRTRSHLNRCSLTSEPIGEISSNVDYSADLTETKGLFPEYKEIYTDCQQQNGMGLDKSWKGWLIPDKTGKRGGKPRFQKQGDICSLPCLESMPKGWSALSRWHSKAVKNW